MKINDCSAEINWRTSQASQRMGRLETLWRSSELTLKTKIDLLCHVCQNKPLQSDMLELLKLKGQICFLFVV